MSLPFPLPVHRRTPFHSCWTLQHTSIFTSLNSCSILLSPSPPTHTGLLTLLPPLHIDSHLKFLCQEYFLHTGPRGSCPLPSCLCPNITFSVRPTVCTSFNIELPILLSILITPYFSLQYTQPSNMLHNLLVFVFIVSPPDRKCKLLEDSGFFSVVIFVVLSLAS